MRRSLSALAGLVLAGCTFAPTTPPPAPPPMPKATFGTWGVDLAGMDQSVKPGDDFFEYVNGGWLKTAVIPADRSSTGSFQNLQILSEKRMREIVYPLLVAGGAQYTESTGDGWLATFATASKTVTVAREIMAVLRDRNQRS